MLRAVIYARVSSDPHNKGKSVADQIKDCLAVCEREGWTVARVFEDNDRSASRYARKDRPEYEKLMDFVRSGDCDVLVTWEASRFQRDLELYVRLREISRQCHVLWSYSGRTYDLDRMDDRLSTGLDALLAERESDQIRERVLRGMRGAAERGRPHGRLLYGYRRVYDPRTGELVEQVIDEEKAAVVREAARRVAAGEALVSIVSDFHRRDIRPPHGQLWSTTQIREMVTRASYIGKRIHQGRVIGEGLWPPILEPPTYYACVQLLSDPRRIKDKDGKIKYLLSGLARCGECGGVLRWQPTTRGASNYLCVGNDRGFGRKGCVSLRLNLFDEYVTAAVIERLGRPDVADLVANEGGQEEAQAALTEAAEKRARLDECYDATAAGGLSATALARIEARLLPEIEAADKRASVLRVSAALRGVVRLDIADVWPTLALAQQREVIRTLMDIELHKSKTWRDAPEQRVKIIWKHDRGSAA